MINIVDFISQISPSSLHCSQGLSIISKSSSFPGSLQWPLICSSLQWLVFALKVNSELHERSFTTPVYLPFFFSSPTVSLTGSWFAYYFSVNIKVLSFSLWNLPCLFLVAELAASSLWNPQLCVFSSFISFKILYWNRLFPCLSTIWEFGGMKRPFIHIFVPSA